MQTNPVEEQTAATWFYCAGLIAIIFSYTLFRADEYLTHSPRDKILGQTLNELRVAQSEVGSPAQADPRH